MPDLNDDLFSSFKDEGAPVHPLPASEVRRRGDRMRRRNNTLATVGGVAAALVAIATPLAIVTGQSDTTDGGPPVATQPTEVSWKQEIPSDFTLGDGLAGPAATAPETSDTPGVRSIEICGRTAFDANDDTVDVAGATYDDPAATGDAGNARTLALYPDAAAAGAVVDDLATAVDGCASEPGNGATLTYELSTSTGIAADEAFLVARNYVPQGEEFATNADYYLVARTGNAVLVTLDPYAVRNDGQVAFEEERVAGVVADLQTFSESANAVATTDGEADLGASIPDDFPLLAGFPEQSDNPIGREGPSRDLDLTGYRLDAVSCGVDTTALPTPTDILYAGFRESAGAQLRQLMTFGSQADAEAYVETVGASYADCTDTRTVYDVSEVPGVGDQAISAVGHPEVDGEVGPGYDVTQLVRVGSAVLHFVASYDGADPVDPATAAADLTTTYVNGNGPVIDAM